MYIVYQFISGSLNYLFVLPSSHSSIRSFFYRVLSSTEVLSTDEESSDTGGESEDELSRNLESLLSSKKTALDLTHEQEEAERQELRRLLMEDQPVSLSLSLSLSLTHTHTHTHANNLLFILFRSVVRVVVILMSTLTEVCNKLKSSHCSMFHT